MRYGEGCAEREEIDWEGGDWGEGVRLVEGEGGRVGFDVGWEVVGVGKGETPVEEEGSGASTAMRWVCHENCEV